MHNEWCEGDRATSIMCVNWMREQGKPLSKERSDPEEFWAMHESFCTKEANAGKPPCVKWASKRKHKTEGKIAKSHSPLR